MRKELRRTPKKKLGNQGNVSKQAAPKSHRFRSTAIWSTVILGLALAVGGMIRLTSQPVSEPTRLADANVAGSWAKGNTAATITLVEYSDFQCSACARYYRITKRLVEELGNDFQMIFRHFPLLPKHANSVLAAKTAEAAGLQGKFWEMHDMLYEKQKEWEKKDRQEAQLKFVQYAVSLGLDAQTFKNDLESQSVADKVYNDARTGRSSGVKSTPTFFLNDQKLVNGPYSYESFKNLILEAKRERP